MGYPPDLNLVRGFDPSITARDCILTFLLGSSMDFTWAPFVTLPLAGQTIINLHIFRRTLLFLAVARGKCLGTHSQAAQHGRSSWCWTHPGAAASLWNFSPAAGAADGGKSSGPHGALSWGWWASDPGWWISWVETSRLPNLLP